MKTASPSLLTAPQVARLCCADLKTIHNWVAAGRIPATRTAGRRLRFQPRDVLELLERYGYPVPPDLRRLEPDAVPVRECEPAGERSATGSATAVEPTERGPEAATRRTVLLVDPDDESRQRVASRLAERYRVRAYGCPVEALLAVSRDRPDLVVTEVDLPGVDGYRVVERLATSGGADHAGVAVVVYSSSADRARCGRAAAVVRKPGPRRLALKADEVLNNRAAVASGPTARSHT